MVYNAPVPAKMKPLRAADRKATAATASVALAAMQFGVTGVEESVGPSLAARVTTRTFHPRRLTWVGLLPSAQR